MACLRVCPQRAIEVGSSYVFIDWSRCDGCAECVQACDAGAIKPRVGGTPPRATPTSAEVVSGTGSGNATADAPAARPRLRVVTEEDLAERAKKPRLEDIAPLAPSWRGWEVLVVLAGVLALFAAEQAALSSQWMVRTVPLGAKPLMRSGVLTLYYAAQLALLAALGFRKGVGFAEAFGLRRFHVTGTAVGVTVLVVVTRLFTLAYAVAAEGFGWKMQLGPMSDIQTYFGRDSVGLVLTVLMIVIVGPFFEELVFRGVLLGYLQERIGASWAIVVSATLFAAFHMNIWMFAPVFVMALAAGWLAVRTRSLWAAYALHLLYNAVPVFLVFALSKQP